MALTPSTSFTQDVNDVHAGVVADTTPDYGQGGNPARGDAANYLLWAKTDKNGDRTFNNPSFGNVLSIMSWEVTMEVGGWYERMLMRIQPYNANPYLVDGVAYYGTTDKVYICIQNSTGNLPTDTNFWREVTDLSELIANPNISVTITNTYVRSIADQGVKQLFANMAKTCACDDKANKIAYTLYGYLIGADSEVLQGNYDDMEEIIEYLESQLTQSS
jgi:hypothetical protein